MNDQSYAELDSMKAGLERANCIACKKWPALILWLLSTVLLISPASASESTKWKTFVPSSGEFSVSLPGKVTVSNSKSGDTEVTHYASRDRHNSYVISRALVPMEHVQDMISGAQQALRRGVMEAGVSNPLEIDEKLSGNGWTGRKYVLLAGSEPVVVSQIIFPDGTDVCYALIAWGHDTSASQRVLGSFKLLAVPKVAAIGKAHGIGFYLGSACACLSLVFLIAKALGLLSRPRDARNQTNHQ